jgi:hypothetical protein
MIRLDQGGGGWGGGLTSNCSPKFFRFSSFPYPNFKKYFSLPFCPSSRGCRLRGAEAKLELELYMKRTIPMESASAFIDEKIKELGDWRGKMLAKVRGIIHQADPEIVEERKWVKPTSSGTPVFSHNGIVCTGETHKSVVKLTFAKGAALKDPKGLFNSSLEGNVRRAIDIHEGDKIDEAALKDLIRAAMALNLKGKSIDKKTSKPKPHRKSPL